MPEVREGFKEAAPRDYRAERKTKMYKALAELAMADAQSNDSPDNPNYKRDRLSAVAELTGYHGSTMDPAAQLFIIETGKRLMSRDISAGTEYFLTAHSNAMLDYKVDSSKNAFTLAFARSVEEAWVDSIGTLARGNNGAASVRTAKETLQRLDSKERPEAGGWIARLPALGGQQPQARKPSPSPNKLPN